MNAKIRTRVFFYLLLLLAVFMASQTAIYLLVEWATCLANPNESMWVGLQETAHAMSLTLLLVPFLVGLAWHISRRVVAPLRAMASTAERVCAGHWEERIATTTMPDDETKRLATSMNAAFDGYTAVLNRLERFAGDAAHQLRTPLAAMRNLGEVALAHPRTDQDYRNTVGAMLTVLDRMTKTVEQLLQLSQLEAGAVQARFAPVSLRTILQRIERAYGPLAEAQGVKLQIAPGKEDPLVMGIEDLLIEMLGNLLDNALRHTSAGGEIRIGVAAAPAGGVCLSIADGGPGIPREYATAIFERFMQIPGAPSGAAGLGLSLAADIACLHGGQLELVNPGQPGARFECRLPRARS